VVSPPYFKYSLPEIGIDPLEPQHLMTKDLALHS